VFRPLVVTAFALFAISSSGCLLLSRPCAPGDWHYHTCNGRNPADGTGCRTCPSPPPPEILDESEVRPDQLAIKPTPERIPPLPSSTGTTGTSRTICVRTPEVAQSHCRDPFPPRTPTKIGSKPEPLAVASPLRSSEPRMPTKTPTKANPAENTIPTDVQECNWQDPNGPLARPAPSVDTPVPSPRSRPTTRDQISAATTQPAKPHQPPPANGTLASKPQLMPFAWGYFGVPGKW
jgi:hypothetical protein